jgi:hypothetical protein
MSVCCSKVCQIQITEFAVTSKPKNSGMRLGELRVRSRAHTGVWARSDVVY